jgi:hypothetical protein
VPERVLLDDSTCESAKDGVGTNSDIAKPGDRRRMFSRHVFATATSARCRTVAVALEFARPVCCRSVVILEAAPSHSSDEMGEFRSI